MDRFAELKTFCIVASTGGFSTAARQLGSATSSVTRLVDALEQRLGAVLLNRSTRSVTLTAAGRAYYEDAQRILEQLDAADDAVSDRATGISGVICVAAPVTFATMYFSPILLELRRRHPRLAVDLRLSDNASNLIDESIDVAIRIGNVDAQANLVARRLGAHRRLLCASPAYLAERGTPRHPADLLEHDCLQFSFADNRRTWRLRRNDAVGDVKAEHMPIEDIAVNSVVQVNNGELLRQASIAGLGIAMLAQWLVRDDLRAGRLVQVLDGYDVNPGSMDVAMYALYQANRRGSRKIHAFVELLSEHLAKVDAASHIP
ncbi:LysR substrate-binding domain-containing protein [Massilia sp. YIM B02763]|uniref:LysR family transcriptional regulator n=1 Tax=Massilia sp. YIM B02763 TaxID=3050130 RepID=UPI0025B718C8|nr:LysR family transcriptional regulator [Massilia sp. YIM B02763]MDN4052026.1 LysR substrate-binding domain-containing protein [Massilia sp. YIM B02763]